MLPTSIRRMAVVGLVVTSSIIILLTAAHANNRPPLPQTLPQQVATLKSEVQTLQSQVAALQSQITQINNNARAQADQTNALAASVQTLQSSLASHTHTVAINHPSVPCGSIGNFAVQNAQGKQQWISVLYYTHCPDPNNNTGSIPAWTENVRSSSPN